MRIMLEPGSTDGFVQQVRSALATPSIQAVTIDMARVDVADPSTLRTLLAAGEAARVAGKPLYLDRVPAAVYKSLHIADLASLFRRADNGIG